MHYLDVEKTAHLIGHRNPIYSIEVGDQSDVFYTAGNDRGVVEWTLREPAFKRVLCPVPTTVYRLHRLPGKGILAAGLQDGSAWLIESDTGKVRARLAHHERAVFGIESLQKGDLGAELVLGAEDGHSSVWSLGSGSSDEQDARLLRDWKVSDSAIRCMVGSPDGRWIAYGMKDGRIHLYHASDFSLHRQWKAHEHTVTSLRFSPDGQHLMSGGRDAKMKCWSLVDGALQQEFVPHMFAIYSICFHPELPIFASASRDKSIKIWSSEDFRLLRNISIENGFESHMHSVNSLSWSPDGHTLISVGDDRLVLCWRVSPAA